MIVYHGTTRKRAAKIRVVGFLPKQTRIWFTKSQSYANRRAKTQAKRDKDRPVTLTCDLNLGMFRSHYGSRGVHKHSHVVVIRGKVPPSVIVDQSGERHLPYVYTAEYLASWINHITRVKPHNGVSRRDPGILRLQQWIQNRLKENPKATFEPAQLLALARQWVPEHLNKYKIDPNTLHAVRIPTEPDAFSWTDGKDEATAISPDEERILEALMSDRPSRRARGLQLLAASDEPDLFEWCMMFFDDESVDVRVAVLESARQCEDAETEMIAPLLDDGDKRIRGAAVAFMTRHAEDPVAWFRAGLTDPEPHVRLQTARHLDELDPNEQRTLFELALYDPNPKVAEMADKMTAGKGYAVEKW